MRTATCDHAIDARSGSCGRPWWPCGRENHGAVCARGSRVGRCVSSLRLRLLAPYRRAAPQGRGSYPLRVEPGDAGIAHWPAVVRSPVYRRGSVICQMSKPDSGENSNAPNCRRVRTVYRHACAGMVTGPQNTLDDLRSLACERGIHARHPGAWCRKTLSRASRPCRRLK